MPKLVYHDSDGVDQVLNLGAEPLLIGRATECAIRTQDAMVSRRHARITWDGNYWIEDLGSSNGVHVGGEKVQKAPFRPGDTVTCGSLVMRMLPDTEPRTEIPDAPPPLPPLPDPVLPTVDRERNDAGRQPADSQVADLVILLSDAVAAVRSNLRAANGEATLLKQPEESAQLVRESLVSAAEALEQARRHLRALAKLLGV